MEGWRRLGGVFVTWRGWTAFVALGIIWGLPYFFIKVALQEVSPLILAFSRVVLATIILMPIAWHLGALRSIGVAALLGTGSISGSLGWAGVGCMLLATICYAVGPLIIQRHLHGLDSIGPLAASLLVASVILLIPAAVEFPSSLPSAKALASIAVLGIVCTAIAMLLMFYLVRHAGASRASVITYINPVVATLLGVIVLDEHLGLGGFIAFALILLGSWLATRGAVTRSSRSEATVNA
jgi:drug/metabolite transporter (DMT)-like permease